MESVKLRILGSEAPYHFSFYFVNVESIRDPNSVIKELQVQIYDIQEDIQGDSNEHILIEFSDYSVIQDESGNNLASQKILGSLHKTEHLSTTDENIVMNTGKSIKYSILTLFSVNMLLKVAIAVSTSYLWTLVHVVQALRFILLININSPRVIGILVEYLAVAVGDIQELEDIVPNVFAYLLLEGELDDEYILPEKFSENGYESPFIINSFGKEATFLIGFT